MAIFTKNSGSYAAISAVLVKAGGAYSPAAAVYAKVGGAYQRCDIPAAPARSVTFKTQRVGGNAVFA
jgi:hypothetical protein